MSIQSDYEDILAGAKESGFYVPPFDISAPGPIGATTPSTGVFTELDITSALPGAVQVTGGLTTGGPLTLTAWPAYTSDAAASADATLPVGSFYNLAGNPVVVRRKV